MIGKATRAASMALSGEASLIRKNNYAEGDGGALVKSGDPVPIHARWSDYTRQMQQMGLPEGQRYAHTPDPGVEPKPGDILTIDSESVTLTMVRRSSMGGVYYVSGTAGEG